MKSTADTADRTGGSLWPIIVGGCHRSGTSLVRRILNSHSRIHCGPEIKFFKDFYGDYLDDPLAHARFFHSARTVLSLQKLLTIFGKAFIEMHRLAAADAGKPRWADKCPENAIYLETWNSLLGEDWLYIHVARNPLDTIASIRDVEFSLAIPSTLDGRIDHYLEYLDAGVSFSEKHPDRSILICYESLVRDPKRVIDRLMAYLGEQTEPQQRAPNSVPHQLGLEDPKIAGASEIHAESIGRWREILNTQERDHILGRCLPAWKRVDPEGAYMRS